MGRTIMVDGFIGRDKGKPAPGKIAVMVAGSGRNESLSVNLSGSQRITVSLHPIEQLIAQTRRIAVEQSKSAEQTIVMDGYFANPGLPLQQGRVQIWAGSDGVFDMLTLEIGGNGQISLPYSPIARLIRSERSFYA